MVDLHNQYLQIQSEVDEAITKVINSCAFINGAEVKAFQNELSGYLGIDHVIACGNGTDALQIALMALDLKPGDEVITTPFTFVATAEVIALLGLKPVFVDIDPTSYNMDANKIAPLITSRTKCIIPVHLFGQCCDMEPILAVAEENGLFVVEDNAQSIGAYYTFSNGEKKMAGTMGDIGCTSFYPTKNLGAFGDGGALFTANDQLGKKITKIVNHGSSIKYYHDEIGVNSRLDSIQAAILRIKLRRLDAYNAARSKAASIYDDLLKSVDGVKIPKTMKFTTHVYHQYTICLDEGREEVQTALKEMGVSSMVYYPVPLHLQDAYKVYGYKKGDFPISEKLANQVLSLPMHTELTEEIQETIITKLKTILLKTYIS